MKTVLVTGGLGFIGSHTAVELLGRGYRVVLADNLSNTRADVLDGIASIAGQRPTWANVDLADPVACRALLQGLGDLAGIVHFAAHKAVGESVQKPLAYYRNNFGSLVNLLDHLAERPACRLIFSSSCTVYGQADSLPIREDAPVKPAESPYGNTKQVGEEILRDGARAHGFRAIALRYFNPIGAHPTARIGELPLGVPQNLVPFITQSAAGLRGPLKVFGNDYPTRDGTCVRDYIHVCDLADAHILGLEYLLKGGESAVFNLGNGSGFSVREVIDAAVRVTGKAIPVVEVERRPGDPPALVGGSDRARDILGWNPQYADIDTILTHAWQWHQKRHG